MEEKDIVWKGDYTDLLSMSMIYQTEEIPLWIVKFSDEHKDKKLRGMNTINIYKALADWLSTHRQHIEAIKLMLDAGDVDVAKHTLMKKLEEIDKTIAVLNMLSDQYSLTVKEKVRNLR